MKKRILSLFTMVCMLAVALFPIMPKTTVHAASIEIGEYVQMGTYYGEPILWRCVDIDENGPLMLSDKILCIKIYDAGGSDTSGSHGRGYAREASGSNYWADSNMRSWLNSTASAGNVEWLCGNPPMADELWGEYNIYDDEAGFLSNFTESERNAMKTVSQKSFVAWPEYENGIYTTGAEQLRCGNDIEDVVQNYDTAYAEYVTDKMFLMDVKQVNAVYNNGDTLGYDYYIGEPTAQCVENSEYKTNSLREGQKWYYWLRSPSSYYYFDCVLSVNSDGHVCAPATNCLDVGVRPAFYLNLSSSNFVSGTGTYGDPYTVSGNGTAVTPTTPEPTDDEYSFYVPTEMNIGDVYGAYVTYGHESLDSSSNFRFVDAQITSSDENVVRLVELGNSYRVQATGEGTATVTAYFEGKTETQNVTVTAEIAETLDDETVLKAKICADNGDYKYMRDAFEIPATIYAKELDGTAAAANEAINAMIGAANGDYTVKNYYEIVLTEMLANEEFYNAIKRKYAINHTSAIIGDANSLVSAALEQYNTTDVPVNQILQVPKESLKDAFDISKFANTLDVESISALDLIDAMLIVNDTVEVYNEKYDQLLYLATATQEQLSVLEGLANSSSGNEEFRDACKSVAGLIVETANMSITDMQAESTLAGVDNFIDKIGSTAVSGLRNLIPGMAIGDAIVGGTKFITNALFNADALANDEIMLKAFEYIDNIVKQEMKNSEDKFNSDPTAENAIEFMAYADFYQTLCAYGCDLAIQFINDYENAGLSGIFGPDVSEDRDAAENIKGYVLDWDFYNPNGTDIAKYLRVTVSTSPSGWAEEYVDKAINNNMLPDYMQNNYQNNITRAEFCSLMTFCLEAKTGESIYTLIEQYGDPGLQTPFDDCVYTFAAFMSRLGIVTGMGDNTFYPLGEITRQQAATMLMRAAEVLGYDVSAPETNLAGVADWAADGVNFVVDCGIMTGTENGFEPEGTYTKEQAITTMVRFCENLGD